MADWRTEAIGQIESVLEAGTTGVYPLPGNCAKWARDATAKDDITAVFYTMNEPIDTDRMAESRSDNHHLTSFVLDLALITFLPTGAVEDGEPKTGSQGEQEARERLSSYRAPLRWRLQQSAHWDQGSTCIVDIRGVDKHSEKIETDTLSHTVRLTVFIDEDWS